MLGGVKRKRRMNFVEETFVDLVYVKNKVVGEEKIGYRVHSLHKNVYYAWDSLTNVFHPCIVAIVKPVKDLTLRLDHVRFCFTSWLCMAGSCDKKGRPKLLTWVELPSARKDSPPRDWNVVRSTRTLKANKKPEFEPKNKKPKKKQLSLTERSKIMDRKWEKDIIRLTTKTACLPKGYEFVSDEDILRMVFPLRDITLPNTTDIGQYFVEDRSLERFVVVDPTDSSSLLVHFKVKKVATHAKRAEIRFYRDQYEFRFHDHKQCGRTTSTVKEWNLVADSHWNEDGGLIPTLKIGEWIEGKGNKITMKDLTLSMEEWYTKLVC